MSEFLLLAPPQESLKRIMNLLPNPSVEKETIHTRSGLNRFLADDLTAPHELPQFPRSAVDGFAVRAQDTYGVSESQAGYLHLQGEIQMGESIEMQLKSGHCMAIHTGGMLPVNADSVLMLEYTQMIGRVESEDQPVKRQSAMVEFTKAVAVGENVIQRGEDVKKNQCVMKAGTQLRPQEIGGCMALGVNKISVRKKPKVAIISSGDELIPPDVPLHFGQVRDINSFTLAAMVEQAGGEPVLIGIIPDDLDQLTEYAGIALKENDLVLITAGSSAGSRDNTANAINSIGKPGVIIHGLSIKPGKPTILAVCANKPVIGLPGNPVSAIVVSRIIVMPLIRFLLGIQPEQIQSTTLARLTCNIPSQAGREDWIPVRLIDVQSDEPGHGKIKFRADPIFGKSNLIFNLVEAQGLLRIDAEVTGISAGEIVEVCLM